MAEVQPADPGARRAALIWLGVAFVAGAIVLWFLETSRPAVAAWLKEDPAQTATRARVLLGGLALVTAGPAVGIGVWLLRLGARVMAAGRFPPPGLRMVQDTVVVAGDAARRAVGSRRDSGWRWWGPASRWPCCCGGWHPNPHAVGGIAGWLSAFGSRLSAERSTADG